MKILIVNTRYFVSGGPERYLFNLKELLERHGHAVVPFSVKSKRNQESLHEDVFAEPMGGQDVPYYDQYRKTFRLITDVFGRLFYSFHVRRRLTALIDKEKPEVAILLNIFNKLSPSVIDACSHQGIKVIHRLSDFYLLCPQAHFLSHGEPCVECLTEGLSRCVRKRCVRGSFSASLIKAMALFLHRKLMKSYSRVDSFICTNTFMRERMIEGGFETERLETIPTFVPNFFEGVVQDKNYLLYFGRFSEEKGVKELLAAFTQSNLSEMGVSLYLVGGQIEELCLDKITRQYLDSNPEIIRVIPFASEEVLGPIIQNASAVVIPSIWYENLPNVLLEAYRYCKPVVAPQHGCFSEHIVHDETGLLYQPGQVASLVYSLEKIGNDREGRQRMSEKIYRYRQRYSAENHYNRISKLINSYAGHEESYE